MANFNITLQDFARDYVPVFQLLIGTLGLFSLILIWWQIRQTRLWNKLNVTKEFCKFETISLTEKGIVSALNIIGIELRQKQIPLKIEQAQLIIDKHEVFLSVAHHLNDLEVLAGIVHSGMVDTDMIYSIHNSRVIRLYRIFQQFIEELRRQRNDEDLFIEFEKLALAWELKRIEQEAKKSEMLSQLKNHLRLAKGIRKIV